MKCEGSEMESCIRVDCVLTLTLTLYNNLFKICQCQKHPRFSFGGTTDILPKERQACKGYGYA